MVYIATINNGFDMFMDDMYFFNTWKLIGFFLVFVVILSLLIKYHTLYTVSFTTTEGWSFSITDYSMRLTGTGLVDYDFITGVVKIKLPSGEEKIYNVSNTISIVGMIDKYSIISGCHLV